MMLVSGIVKDSESEFNGTMKEIEEVLDERFYKICLL
jgi:hypothetical protein